MRQGVWLHFAQAAIELAVEFPIAHGLAARAALESRREIARIEAADEIDERGAHRLDRRLVMPTCAGERLTQPLHGVEPAAVVRLEQFLDQLLDAVALERGQQVARCLLVGHAQLVALFLLAAIVFLEAEQ